jgi:hypothetical protein
MFRTIMVAAAVFAFAAFVLHNPALSGPFEEPVLLLVMGTLFLVFGRLFSGPSRRIAPSLVEREA